MIDPFVHKQKDLLLTFRFQKRESHRETARRRRPAPVTGLVLLRTGVRAFLIAEQIRQKQLRIVGIFGAVDGDEAALLVENSFFHAVFIGQLRDVAFARAGLSLQESAGRAGIGDRRLACRRIASDFPDVRPAAERHDLLLPRRCLPHEFLHRIVSGFQIFRLRPLAQRGLFKK